MDYEKEIHRLKVKCNSYAKRLVNEGFDDVVWEVTNGPHSLFAAIDKENKHDKKGPANG